MRNLGHEKIRIRGGRVHNLKNINLDLPRNRLIVVTGLSGSGKSSLAFDTLYAEGQRRYVESLSVYTRQFIHLMQKPDVDSIEGLSPAISIRHKPTSHNPRSTLGTITEIQDYLRLLFARIGVVYCPIHDIPLKSETISQMVATVLAMPTNTRLMILAPLLTNSNGEHTELFLDMQKQGFIRFLVRSGKKTHRKEAHILEIDELSQLKKTKYHSIDVVVDRLKVRNSAKQRLIESFETTLKISNHVVALDIENGHEYVFNLSPTCSICSYSAAELEPRLFSFNSPIGACTKCNGLGLITSFDPKLFMHSPLPLASEAIKLWERYYNRTYKQVLRSITSYFDVDVTTPFENLPKNIQKFLLFGSYSQMPLECEYRREHVDSFEGIIPGLKRRYEETRSPIVREELKKYLSNQICPDCKGARLKSEALSVKIGEKDVRAIHEVNRMSLHDVLSYFKDISLSGMKKEIACEIIKEIYSRVSFLNEIGLGYLCLDRSTNTLSGGEIQRIRLASQISSGLTGVLYVLDEPSIGLHQRDNAQLINTLKNLRDLGNTVVVVEHDQGIILSSDYVIDMGPGAGKYGGTITAFGSPMEIRSNHRSITGRYLSGLEKIHFSSKRRKPDLERVLHLSGAYGNNLKHVSVNFPIGLITCVTGVSGSGKSTLINDTLYRAVAQHLYGSSTEPAPFKEIKGLDNFDKVINIDQSPLGRTPFSNPATYTHLFSSIRDLFASLPVSKERGYNSRRFSFNIKGGRCEACKGEGMIKVQMYFLPDAYAPCDVCKGTRYNRETLEIRYKGCNIRDVLDMSIDEAYNFFSSIPIIYRKLETLLDVGLGYIQLGQSSTTFSGGEAQRIKLSSELSKPNTGRTLYILDEPTIGLHFRDIELLLKIIHRINQQNNTIVIIEHNLEVIKIADWVIDLGPEGGPGGGQIIIQGTPEMVATCPRSFTGKYLSQFLKKDF